MLVPFSKMQGLGNDFVVVNRLQQTFDLPKATVVALADRRFGIGFDQLLLIDPPQQPDHDFYCRIFNADGSEAANCGNGARCVARYIHGLLSDRADLILGTCAGELRTHLCADGQVQVRMGIPKITALDSVELPSPQGDCITAVEAEVELGNLHLIVNAQPLDDTALAELDAHLRTLAYAAYNINFAHALDEQTLKLRTYEAGSGPTLACGSGACATAAAMMRNGSVGRSVSVQMPGGTAQVVWSADDADIELTGPAECVYQGVVEIA